MLSIRILLNNDYKLFSKILAMILKKVIPS